MFRHLTLLCVIGLTWVAGCSVPGPAQYDDAMLREYFGKSPAQVEEAFGKPQSVAYTDSQLPPANATPEERAQFNQSSESMSYQYATPDGDLVFHFNLNDKVHAITYSGRSVSPTS